MGGHGGRITLGLLAASLVAAIPAVLTRIGPDDGGHRLDTEAPSEPESFALDDPAELADVAPLAALELPEPMIPDALTGEAEALSVAAPGDGEAATTTSTTGTTADSDTTAATTTTTGSETTATSEPEPSDASADPATTTSTSDSDGDPAGSDGDEPTTASTATTAAPTTTTAPATTAPPAPPPVASSVPGAGERVLYVDGSSGYAHNPGTEDQPFRRPIEAIAKAAPGTTIYLRGGTYDTSTHGAFVIRTSGTPDKWIRIAPYPGERVELVAGGEYGSAFEILGASYVEVSGFVMRGRSDSIHGSGVFIKDRAHDIRVINNRISGFGGAGISVVESSRFVIEGNDVRDNAMRSHYQGSGISLFELIGPSNGGGSFTNVIRGNYVVRNRNETPHLTRGEITDGNCIIMDRFDVVGYSGRTLIENNVCAENGGRGIHSYRSSNFVVRNNTLYHNMGSGGVRAGRGELTVGEARNAIFANNLVINRSGVDPFVDNNNVNSRFINNYVASGPIHGEGNQILSTTSIFSSTSTGGSVTQFRPLGSAGLGGSADGGHQSSTDFSGRSRPNPGAVGAFEP